MKFSFKEDAKRIVVICAASVIMALNIKTFVDRRAVSGRGNRTDVIDTADCRIVLGI